MWLGEWRSLMHNIDILESKRNVFVVSFDFGSIMNFKAKQTLNSSEDAHGIADIFLVHTNQPDVCYKEDSSDGTATWKTARIVDCDKWVTFADCIMKGKMNDVTACGSKIDYII